MFSNLVDGVILVVDGTPKYPGIAFVKYSDKNNIIRSLLIMLKFEYYAGVKWTISQCRLAGYDYPEFQIMLKSLAANEQQLGIVF